MLSEVSYPIPAAGVSDVDAGSILYAFIVAQVTITPPTGWTVDQAGTRGGFTYWIGHKTLVAGDLGTAPRWTFAIDTVAAALWFIVNGATNGVDRTSFAATPIGGAGTLSAPSINPRAANDLLIAIFLINANVRINLPADMNPETVSGGSQLSFAMASLVLTSSAATGSKTANWNGTADAVAMQVAFRGTTTPIIEMAASVSV